MRQAVRLPVLLAWLMAHLEMSQLRRLLAHPLKQGLQLGATHGIDALQLAREQFAVGVADQMLDTPTNRLFQPAQQRVIFHLVIGGDADWLTAAS